MVALDPGVRFDEQRMRMVKVLELEEEDQNTAADKKTIEEMRKIADTIFQCVQFTSDCPSSHMEEITPVLDLTMYVGEDGLLKYQYYEKPCASKFVVQANSANSKKMKMSVLVEHGMRRMRNCSRGLDCQVRRRVMKAYAMKLRRNGILLA